MVTSWRSRCGSPASSRWSSGESVLYPALHSLEQRKLLRTRERAVEGRTCIYYELTAKGKRRLADLKAEWRRISRGVDAVLGGAHG